MCSQEGSPEQAVVGFGACPSEVVVDDGEARVTVLGEVRQFVGCHCLLDVNERLTACSLTGDPFERSVKLIKALRLEFASSCVEPLEESNQECDGGASRSQKLQRGVKIHRGEVRMPVISWGLTNSSYACGGVTPRAAGPECPKGMPGREWRRAVAGRLQRYVRPQR